MLWVAFTAALTSLAAPAGNGRSQGSDQPQAVRVTTALAMERISFPRIKGSLEMVLDALGSRIVLRAGREAAVVAARAKATAGGICPNVTVKGGDVELRCRTRRFDAVLTSERGIYYLDIHELRGLPWRAGPDEPPLIHFEPFRSGLGTACPGDTAGAKGECALRAGKMLDAAVQFRAALDTPLMQMAAIRLGDMALATGDPNTAFGWYLRSGLLGIFGRMSRGRICEVNGECLVSTYEVTKAYDASGLPEPVRADMRLRAIRAEAYQGRLVSAISMMQAQIKREGVQSICREAGALLCRRIVLAALNEQLAAPPAEGKPEAIGKKPEGDSAHPVSVSAAREPSASELILEVYFALPQWDRGVLSVELAQAAAEVATRLGAPIFGGHVLASVASGVEPRELVDYHLLRAAELFLQGGDIPRTRLVVEYATTANPRRIVGARWKAVLAVLAARNAAEDPARARSIKIANLDPEAVQREIAAAQAAGERIREAIKSLEATQGGTQ